MIKGKPSIAIMAAFCWAFAAIAAKKLNTKLRLQPPKNTSPIKAPIFKAGLPKNKLNKIKLRPLIARMSKELKSNFASIKFWGLTIEPK